MTSPNLTTLLIGMCLLIGVFSGCLFTVATAHAQPSLEKEFLDAHNKDRAEVGDPPLYWSDDAAKYAQDYANKRKDCQPVHSNGPYGENIVLASGDLSPTQAVKYWFDEKVNYNRKTNECVDRKECHHYTQLVWKNTTDVGCGMSKCTNGWTFVVCSYYPPGNVVGEQDY